MTVVELKAKLKALHLKISGNKAELVQRLKDALASSGDGGDTAPPASDSVLVDALGPIDENGQKVDWWFLYKVPKGLKVGKGTTKGYEYVYFDAHSEKVEQSVHLLTDGKGALDFTISNLFHNASSASVGYILYNDEKPARFLSSGNDNGNDCHTKGVLAFDTASNSAFWLLHSWPKYVDPEETALPTPEYGQTFLCLHISLDTCSQIAGQMLRNQQPQVYNSKLPTGLSVDDNLYKLSQSVNNASPGESETLDYTTVGGLPFKVIAKNRLWAKDFWNDLVSPTLGVDMAVETWIRGAIASTNSPDGHKIVDVKLINFTPLGIPWSWSETQDHAKWGVSKTSDWICIADINRMVSQENRGGGTIAFQSKILWAALSQVDGVQ